MKTKSKIIIVNVLILTMMFYILSWFNKNILYYIDNAFLKFVLFFITNLLYAVPTFSAFLILENLEPTKDQILINILLSSFVFCYIIININ